LATYEFLKGPGKKVIVKIKTVEMNKEQKEKFMRLAKKGWNA